MQNEKHLRYLTTLQVFNPFNRKIQNVMVNEVAISWFIHENFKHYILICDFVISFLGIFHHRNTCLKEVRKLFPIFISLSLNNCRCRLVYQKYKMEVVAPRFEEYKNVWGNRWLCSVNADFLLKMHDMQKSCTVQFWKTFGSCRDYVSLLVALHYLRGRALADHLKRSCWMCLKWSHRYPSWLLSPRGSFKLGDKRVGSASCHDHFLQRLMKALSSPYAFGLQEQNLLPTVACI